MSRELAQPLLDLEAVRGGDVLQVDPAEAGRDALDRLDDRVGVTGGDVQADRVGVDVGEGLEQLRLALHDRHGGLRADVPQPSTAVPSVTTATELCLMVWVKARLGSAAMAEHTRATPGV
jgi:hypothetical protein